MADWSVCFDPSPPWMPKELCTPTYPEDKTPLAASLNLLKH